MNSLKQCLYADHALVSPAYPVSYSMNAIANRCCSWSSPLPIWCSYRSMAISICEPSPIIDGIAPDAAPCSCMLLENQSFWILLRSHHRNCNRKREIIKNWLKVLNRIYSLFRNFLNMRVQEIEGNFEAHTIPSYRIESPVTILLANTRIGRDCHIQILVE